MNPYLLNLETKMNQLRLRDRSEKPLKYEWELVVVANLPGILAVAQVCQLQLFRNRHPLNICFFSLHVIFFCDKTSNMVLIY